MRFSTLLPLLTLAIGACATDTDDLIEDGTHAIAAIDRPGGNRIEFLATAEGDVFLSEVRPIGNQPALSPEIALSVDPRDIYLALAGEEAPQ